MTIQFTDEELSDLMPLEGLSYQPDITFSVLLPYEQKAQFKPFGGGYILSIWNKKNGYGTFEREGVKVYSLKEAVLMVKQYIDGKLEIFI